MMLACLIVSRLAPAATATGAAADANRTLNAGPAITILAWGGVPYDKATPESYAEFAEAGFNLNFSGAASADMMQKLLDLAQQHGVKQLISIPELQRDPEAIARRFKDHSANGGYYLRDEPDATLFPKLAAWARQIQIADAVHPCYVNLLPTYADLNQLKAPSYQKYLERFIAEVPVPMLSWDHYPVFREGDDAARDRLRPDFYYNLELGSAAARKAGRPLWLFALATAHNPYPVPELSHLRVEAFSDLAYGAQVIQYFTYWTQHSNVWNFHQGPIDADGKRTATYDRVKQVNGEIQALRGAFLGSRVISVAHTGGAALPHGTTRYTPAAPVKSFETQGTGCVVSILEKGKLRFLVVVNRDIHKPAPVEIAFDPAAGAMQAERNGSLKPLDASGVARPVLEPGDVAVFAWPDKLAQ
jgi:hypothetical protein